MADLLPGHFRQELSIGKLTNYLGKHICSVFNFTLLELECPVQLPRNIKLLVQTNLNFSR